MLQAVALEIEADISINSGTLKPEQREPLFDLRERLERYLEERQWDEAEEHLKIGIPIALQFTSAVETGSGWEYTAQVATGNKRDISVDDNAWRFVVPDGEFQFNDTYVDSFLALINFYVLQMIAYEYDKLSEFGGEALFQQARQIGIMARLDERSEGWDRRMQKLEDLLDPRYTMYRSLRWVTHTAYWFRTVMKNDYEAWKTARLALDMVEEIDNPGLLTGYFKANHRSITSILIKGKDQEGLFLLMRLDTFDPERNEYYQDQLLRLNS